MKKKSGKSAEVSELGDLHKALTKFFHDRLNSGPITAAEANVIRQFLKDNNIEATRDNPDMQAMASVAFPTFADEDGEHIN